MWPLAPFSQPATRCPTDAPCSHCAQGSTNNATCFIGPHRIYDPWTKSFMNLIPGQGHFGPDAIPGDARWRRGESVSLKTARDTCGNSLKPKFLPCSCTHTPPRALTPLPTKNIWPTGWSRWSSRSTPRWSTRPAERPFRSKEDARSQRHGQQQQDPNAHAWFTVWVVGGVNGRFQICVFFCLERRVQNSELQGV